MWPVRRADLIASFMCLLSKNSESLNLLDPQGPVEACAGMKLIKHYTIYKHLGLKVPELLTQALDG
jgi:hypothetical protein